ncbi:MAG: hypothetical protein K2X32_04590 [Phycisphaerales bacterium]|nr:hypothetical protein [Phycisphaerales bacterium]
MKYAKFLSLLAGATLTSAALADGLTADQVRAIVAEMNADAATRSSLLQGGAAAGRDGKFFLASADNKFRLNFSGFAQFRYTINVRDEDGVAGDPAPAVGNGGGSDTSFQSGFSNRRTAVIFDGHVVNPDLKFNIRLVSTGSGAVRNDDIFMTYALDNNWYIKGGQYKKAFSRENIMSDTMIIGAERSVTDSFFSAGRVQGLELGYKTEEWMFSAQVDDGFNSNDTAFNANQTTTVAFPIGGQAAYSVGGRADWIVSGEASQLRDATSKPTDKQAFGLGAAVNWQQARKGPAELGGGTLYPDVLNWTVDAQFEDSGWSAMGGVFGSYSRVSGPNNTLKVNGHNIGLFVQGAYRWSNESEIFVRYDGLYLDENADRLALGNAIPPQVNELSPENYQFITFGYTHYFADHAAKFTLDCILTLNPTAQFNGAQNRSLQSVFNISNTNLGLQGSSKGLEAAIRAQFQIMF